MPLLFPMIADQVQIASLSVVMSWVGLSAMYPTFTVNIFLCATRVANTKVSAWVFSRSAPTNFVNSDPSDPPPPPLSATHT